MGEEAMQLNNPQIATDKNGRRIVAGDRVRISNYGTFNGEYVAIGEGEHVNFLRDEDGDVIPLQIPTSCMEVIE